MAFGTRYEEQHVEKAACSYCIGFSRTALSMRGLVLIDLCRKSAQGSLRWRTIARYPNGQELLAQRLASAREDHSNQHTLRRPSQMTVVRRLPSQRLILAARKAFRPRVVLDLQVIRSTDFARLDGDDR